MVCAAYQNSGGASVAIASMPSANSRLVQISRGLYVLPDNSRFEQHQLADIAVRYPHSVFCLLTALYAPPITLTTDANTGVVTAAAINTTKLDSDIASVAGSLDSDNAIYSN